MGPFEIEEVKGLKTKRLKVNSWSNCYKALKDMLSRPAKLKRHKDYDFLIIISEKTKRSSLGDGSDD